MNTSDKTAIVLFDNDADILMPMTSDKEALELALQQMYSYGGTNFDSAISSSVLAFNSYDIGAMNTNNRIILLSDGVSYVTTSVMYNAKTQGIKIYTVSLGYDTDDATRKFIADYTGGEFFKAYTADELVDIYTDLGVGTSDFDTTDTDGDGLYDAVEVAGIRLQNGTILKNDLSRDVYSSIDQEIKNGNSESRYYVGYVLYSRS